MTYELYSPQPSTALVCRLKTHLYNHVAHFSADNAAMIGWASMHRFLAGESDPYTIDHRKKWSIEDLDK